MITHKEELEIERAIEGLRLTDNREALITFVAEQRQAARKEVYLFLQKEEHESASKDVRLRFGIEE